MSALRRALVPAFFVLVSAGCKRKHIAVDSAPELPYPACGSASPSELLAKGELRAGETSLEKDVVERYEIRKEPCRTVFTGRQEWRLAATDVEVVYGPDGAPIRAWKRMTVPGSKRPDGNADIRKYELRTPEISIKKRSPEGETVFEVLKAGGKTPVAAGAKPTAVIGPGRGLMTMWIRRAKLDVGGRSRDVVLDFREAVERFEEATLVRDEDRLEPSLGKTVRVYTFYGRETVFADETDAVIGDLGGMRPSSAITASMPPPTPQFGAPDPVATP